MGFGTRNVMDQDGEFVTSIRSANVNVIDKTTCSNNWTKEINEFDFCTDSTISASCIHDTGGPIIKRVFYKR